MWGQVEDWVNVMLCARLYVIVRMKEVGVGHGRKWFNEDKAITSTPGRSSQMCVCVCVCVCVVGGEWFISNQTKVLFVAANPESPPHSTLFPKNRPLCPPRPGGGR